MDANQYTVTWSDGKKELASLENGSHFDVEVVKNGFVVTVANGDYVFKTAKEIGDFIEKSLKK